MPVVMDSVGVVISILGLWWGAEWLVEAASRIAKRFGVSELIIGLTVVSFGTSAPEFAVTVGAALKGQGDISIGNVIGSNIFNLGFILGGVALLRPITTTRSLVYRDGTVLASITLLLLLFLRDLHLEQWEGITMMSLLVVYLVFLTMSSDRSAEEIPAAADGFHWYEVLRLLAGLALVLGSGDLLVDSASALARVFGLSEWVIGVTIVAAGTSAPELATSIVAVYRGMHGISAGNLIGSDIFNLLGVLGLAGAMRPMTVVAGAYGSLFLLSGMVLVTIFVMRTGWRVSRLEGGLLVGIALMRWIADFTR